MAFNKYNQPQQNNFLDVDAEDFEINPHRYANKIIDGIIEAPIKALENNKSFDDGLMGYTIYVEMLETLARANHWIGNEKDNYQELVSKKLAEEKANLDAEKNMIRKDAKISKIKFEFLLEKILNTRAKEKDVIV